MALLTQITSCHIGESVPCESAIHLTMWLWRWGEEAARFLACLERHCADRGLEKEGPSHYGHAKAMYLGGKPAAYWVCGDCRRFAAAQPLTQTAPRVLCSLCKQPTQVGRVGCGAGSNPLYSCNENVQRSPPHPPHCLALALLWLQGCTTRQEPCPFSTQMVSAGPASGGESALLVFASRHSVHHPCSVYELYISLVNSNPDYTYDMYTAMEHEWVKYDGSEREQRSAVGILDGLAAVDNDAEDKGLREQHFPLALLHEHGLKVECRNGNASVDADRLRILDTIGASADKLDATIHGRVAAAGLLRAVGEGGELARCFLEAAQCGYLRKLELSGISDSLSRDLFANMGVTAGTLVSLDLSMSEGLVALDEGNAS